MRKQVSILLCLLVLMITLTGCLGQGQDQQTQEEVDQDITQEEIDQNLTQEEEKTDAEKEKEKEETRKYYEELDEQREEELDRLNILLNESNPTLEDCESFKDEEIKGMCTTSIMLMSKR